MADDIAIIMLTHLARLLNEGDERFSKNDMFGLSQTRTVVRWNAASTQQIMGQSEWVAASATLMYQLSVHRSN
jgi:hypothetical protein